MADLQDIQPKWMEDGKGLRGDPYPTPAGTVERPAMERPQTSSVVQKAVSDPIRFDTTPFVAQPVPITLPPWIYPTYAAFPDDSTSDLFVGFDDVAGEYKVTLTDGSHGLGLHAGYLEIDSDVFLGFGSDSTKHLEIRNDTAFVSLGASAQAFLGYGDASWHLELDQDGYNNQIKSSSIALTKGTGGDQATLTYDATRGFEWFLQAPTGNDIDIWGGGILFTSGAETLTIDHTGITAPSGASLSFGTTSIYEDESITYAGAEFSAREISYIGNDGHIYTQTILATDATDEGEMTWSGICNSDGTFTITVSAPV